MSIVSPAHGTREWAERTVKRGGKSACASRVDALLGESISVFWPLAQLRTATPFGDANLPVAAIRTPGAHEPGDRLRGRAAGIP